MAKALKPGKEPRLLKQNEKKKAGSTPDKPKRLLVVTQHFWPENFRISDIVQGFVENGVEVDVLCGLPNYPLGEWFEGYGYTGPRRQEYEGAQIFRSGEVRRKGNSTVRIFLNFVSFPIYALFNLPRLAGRRYDAVFCNETSPVMMMLPAIVLAKLRRIPLTTYVLDLWPENLLIALPQIKSKFWRGVLQWVSNWHYRRSNKLIAMSDALGERLLALYGGAKKPPEVTVIPQYCEDFYAQQIEDADLRQKYGGRFNILFAGNISPVQDMDNLLNAMELVKAETGDAVRCMILGDGMSRDAFFAAVEQRGMQDVFEYCGSVPAQDIPRWTGVADALFAGLAKDDMLGLTVPGKIPSYFAAGRPMLVAADMEAARVPRESGAALVSSAGDAKELADNILRLYHMTQQQRDEMGRNGREHYERYFRREVLLKQLLEFTFD